MEKGRKDKYLSAIEAVKANRLKDAFELYCSLFFPLGHPGLEFLSFYRYQLATYLSRKSTYTLALPEGDMVSDLIGMTYDEVVDEMDHSDIPISNVGRINILESVKIVFPCQNDTDLRKRAKSVAK